VDREEVVGGFGHELVIVQCRPSSKTKKKLGKEKEKMALLVADIPFHVGLGPPQQTGCYLY
jgi:hypothetical protein